MQPAVFEKRLLYYCTINYYTTTLLYYYTTSFDKKPSAEGKAGFTYLAMAEQLGVGGGACSTTQKVDSRTLEL